MSSNTEKLAATRQRKARTALREGKWSIAAENGGWRVTTSATSYLVRAAKDQPAACTCDDFPHSARRHGIPCKHMYGVEFWLRARDGKAKVDLTGPHNTEKRITMGKTYAQIQTELLVPFKLSEVRFRPQSATRRSDNKSLYAKKGNALLVAYAPTQAYNKRLDTAAPGQWEKEITQIINAGSKIGLAVSVTIAGKKRSNVGEANINDDNAFTRAYAQAFKRACADHGLGRYFYDLPAMWVQFTCEDGKKLKYSHPALPPEATPEGWQAIRKQARSAAQRKTPQRKARVSSRPPRAAV